MNLAFGNEKVGRGLLLKIVGISTIVVVISVLVFSLLSIYAMQSLSEEIAVTAVKDKINSDMASFEFMLAQEYGSFSLRGNELTDQNDVSLTHQYTVIDRVSSMLNVVATVFVRDGNDFRRVTTSISDNSGRRAVDSFLGQDSPVISVINSGNDFVGNAPIFGREYITKYRPLFRANSREVIGILFIGVEMSAIENLIRQNRNAQIVRVSVIAAAIIAFSIVLNAVTNLFIVLKPIRSAVDMLKEISQGEGDLTKRLKVSSKDEIGDMALYFNMTLEKIKNLIIIIKQQSEVLSGIGVDLSNNMTKTADAINEITGNMQGIKTRAINQSASVTETNATMEQITSNISKLNEHIERQTQSVSQSSSAIEEMLANIQSVTNTLAKNSANVKQLQESSEAGRLGLQEVSENIQEIARESAGLLEINSVIQNISSQTNLLSMNAAIEAAHAGESGRGFAVVADEIRKLAENSSAQSKTIKTILKKIKESIDKITRSTENVLNKFVDIDSGVKTVSDQEENILNAMEEQGQGSKLVLESISHVNEITRQVSDGSESMLEGSQQVIHESRNLEKSTQEINNGINDIAFGVERINTAVGYVNSISAKNRQNIDTLVHEVSRFKVD